MDIWKKLKITTKIAILDWLFLFAIMLLLLIVYIPKYIWMQEKEDRDESRFRMRTISNAAEFYKELTGNYTSDGEKMFALVEAGIDSLYADSLFVGEQQIIIDNHIYNIKIIKGFDYRADTTFSVVEQIKKTIIDKVYWTLEYTDSTQSSVDTNYVNSTDIEKRMDSYRFNPANTSLLADRDSIISSKEFAKLDKINQGRHYKFIKDTIKIEVSEREEIINNYLRKKFHLNPNLLSCPLSQKDYILTIEQLSDGEDIFIVESPVDESNIKRRYLFFQYDPGDHGYIRSGVQSWAEKE